MFKCLIEIWGRGPSNENINGKNCFKYKRKNAERGPKGLGYGKSPQRVLGWLG